MAEGPSDVQPGAMTNSLHSLQPTSQPKPCTHVRSQRVRPTNCSGSNRANIFLNSKMKERIKEAYRSTELTSARFLARMLGRSLRSLPPSPPCP